MNARQRRKQHRAELRRVLAGGLVFAARAPEWARATPAELLASLANLPVSRGVNAASTGAFLAPLPAPLALDSDHELAPYRAPAPGHSLPLAALVRPV